MYFNFIISKLTKKLPLFIDILSAFVPVIIILVLVIVIYHQVILRPTEMIYPASDIQGIFYFEKIFLKESIINFHEIPLWNPYSFSGVPFLANPSAAVLYPLTIFYVLFPPHSVFGFVMILDVFLLGTFTYLYSKSINLSKYGSLFTAISTMFSASVATQIIPGHLLILDTLVWFPLLLYLTEKIIIKKNNLFSLFFSIAVSLTLLAGHPQIAVYSLIILTLYTTFRIAVISLLRQNILFFVQTYLYFLFLLLIGGGISAIQLIPTIELSSLSTRSNGVTSAFASSFSIHPYQAISVLFPHFFGNDVTYWGKSNYWSATLYVGLISLPFILIAALFVKNKLTLLFLLLFLLSFIYATGEHGFLFAFMYKYVPSLNSFRVPSRMLFFSSFSLSILAGIGFDYFVNRIIVNYAFMKKLSISCFIASFIALTTTVFVYFSPNINQYYNSIILRNSYGAGLNHDILLGFFKNDLLSLTIMLFALSLVCLLYLFKKINILLFKSLIIYLLIIDLFSFGIKFVSTEKKDNIFSTPPAVKLIASGKDLFRVIDMQGVLKDPSIHNIQNATGVHSLRLQDLQTYLWSSSSHLDAPYESFLFLNSINNLNFYKLLNIRYIASNSKVVEKDLREVISSPFYLYEINPVVPRAYMVSEALTVDSGGDVLKILSKKTFDINKTAVFETVPGKLLNISKMSIKANITFYSPNRIELITDNKDDSYLVLSEIYYPGWKAFVDGNESKIFRTNYLYRGLYLPKGKHSVRFVFFPLSVVLGLTVSLISIGTLLLLGFFLKTISSRTRLKGVRRLH